MYRLGLTGSIASGKSTVLSEFAAAGVPVFSSDAAVHDLYAGEALPEIEALFPGVARNGVIDRGELSRQLVAAPARLVALEAVVHPLVRGRIARFLAEAEASGAPLAVVDIPLLFENGVDWGFDGVLVTQVPEAELRRRALARPGMSVEKRDAILARQMPQAEKARRATFVVDTSRSREAVKAEIEALIHTLRAGR